MSTEGRRLLILAPFIFETHIRVKKRTGLSRSSKLESLSASVFNYNIDLRSITLDRERTLLTFLQEPKKNQLWTYGDESGNHLGAKYCLISGYVTSSEIWSEFNRQWKAILEHHSVEEFHSTDFFHHRRSQSSSNPYRGWTIDRRTRFINELVDVTNSLLLLPIGGAVEIRAFNELSYEQKRYFTGGYLETSWSVRKTRDSDGTRATMRRQFKTTGAPSRPYAMAFNLFLEELHNHVPEFSVVHTVLDRQRQLENYISEYFDKYWASLITLRETQFASLNFRDSHSEPGLQAADLYAYLQARRLEGRATEETAGILSRLSNKVESFKIADDEYFSVCWDSLQEDLRNENSVANVTDGRLEVLFHEGP